MNRLLTALAALVVAWLGCASGAAAEVPPAAAVVYTYDGHHHVAVWTSTTTERGPLSSTYGYTNYDAVDRRLHGASARPAAVTTLPIITYDHPALVVHSAGVVTTPLEATQDSSWPLSSFQRSDVAAEGDIHGPLRDATRDVDTEAVVENGEIYRQDDGRTVYVLSNGDGTYSVVVREPGSTRNVTKFGDLTRSSLDKRISEGRWTPAGER